MPSDHGRHAAGIIISQSVRCAILRGHQREVHQIAPGKDGADGQPRKRRFWEIPVGVGNLNGLIERLLGVQNHQSRHELGDGGDGRSHVRVAGEEHRRVVLIDDEHRTGLQSRVGDAACVRMKCQKNKANNA
jgi:hypothetical protein